MHTEKKINGKDIFKGHVIHVQLDTVELENGRTASREVVRHPGGACILALTPQDEVYLVRQYRYALGEELLELPAGKLEYGEDPFLAAKRELEEECGLTADRFVDLHPLYPTVGYDSEIIYTWLATGLHDVAQHLDEGEFLDVEKVPFAKALAWVMDGTIRDGKTVAGLLKLAALRAKGELE